MTNNEKDLSDNSVSQNREIKFRAWNKTKEKRYFDDRIMEQKYKDSWYMTYFSIHDVNIPEDNYIIMQYTWLKDKNWVEVYEWDLLKYKWNNLVREVDMVKWCWSIVHWKNIYKLFEYWLEYEVIWNIYQNKDLIWTVW